MLRKAVLRGDTNQPFILTMTGFQQQRNVLRINSTVTELNRVADWYIYTRMPGNPDIRLMS
ncbi:MAG: hypothetical protein L6Q47_07470 [Ignavibacteriaceae bacterium]|nr:hypothetical protein [Ignavibacteriaceae bacterium]